MAITEGYRAQVALLVRLIPIVAAEDCFALKGGTAINLFVRDLPRLSVDIDLAYLPVEDRETSLANIDAAMRRIEARAKAVLRGVTTQLVRLGSGGPATKVLVRQGGALVKVEVTPVSRGVVYAPEQRAVSERVQDAFGFAEMGVVSFPDLYAGKLVAAMDRQHPRDLFDVRDLFRHEGVSDELRRAFIVYILSHNRPMGEVLGFRPKDLRPEYERGFVGMTEEPVPLEDLVATQRELRARIVGEMPEAHRRFLLSFKRGEPAWDLLGLEDVDKLPAVRWKTENLGKLAPDRRAALLGSLETVLAPTG